MEQPPQEMSPERYGSTWRAAQLSLGHRSQLPGRDDISSEAWQVGRSRVTPVVQTMLSDFRRDFPSSVDCKTRDTAGSEDTPSPAHVSKCWGSHIRRHRASSFVRVHLKYGFSTDTRQPTKSIISPCKV